MREAVFALDNHPAIQVLQQSSLYETKPVGPVAQEDFLNMAVAIRTDLSPDELLDVIHDTEASLHRERIVRWGPRTVDIDILLYGDVIVSSERLTIPHKEMLGRAFVLIPLRDIYPAPLICGRDYAILLEGMKDKNEIRMVGNIPNNERIW